MTASRDELSAQLLEVDQLLSELDDERAALETCVQDLNRLRALLLETLAGLPAEPQ